MSPEGRGGWKSESGSNKKVRQEEVAVGEESGHASCRTRPARGTPNESVAGMAAARWAAGWSRRSAQVGRGI